VETGKIGIVILLLIFITPLQVLGAEHLECTEATVPNEAQTECVPKCEGATILNPEKTACVPNCGAGTVLDSGTSQCVFACGEGTKEVGGKCELIQKFEIDVPLGEIFLIFLGVATGVGISIYGIWRSNQTRKQEIKKEDMEIIQSYGQQMSEIVTSEQNLETKLDCSLYAERYLDTLEQIASLNKKNMIRRDVSDYFENHFKYGIHLWKWYKENIEKIPNSILDNEFKLGFKQLDSAKLKKDAEQDRWYFFRWWCLLEKEKIPLSRQFRQFLHMKVPDDLKEPIIEFKFSTRSKLIEFRIKVLGAQKKKLKNKKIPTDDDALKEHNKKILENQKRVDILQDLKKIFSDKIQKTFQDDPEKEAKAIFEIVQKHHKGLESELSPFEFINRYSINEQFAVLPDSMQSDFDDIPDENGMTKDELVEVIQKFGEILNNISSKERDLNSKLDCSLYAEQYLDTVEQIATLYRKRVIPKKAADYFENKFSYGINILNWYNKYVTQEYCSCDEPQKLDPSTNKELEECGICRCTLEFRPNILVFQDDKEERWTDFKWFCRGGDTRKNIVTKFNEEKIVEDFVKNQIKQLKRKISKLNETTKNIPEDKKSSNRDVFKLNIYQLILGLLNGNYKVTNEEIVGKIQKYNETIETKKCDFQKRKLSEDDQKDYQQLKDAQDLTDKQDERYHKLRNKNKLSENDTGDLLKLYDNKQLSDAQIPRFNKLKEDTKIGEDQVYAFLKLGRDQKLLIADEKKYHDLKDKMRFRDKEEEIFKEFNPRELIKEYGKGNQSSVLPETMYDYALLPDEEGIKPSEVLEIMRNYGKDLNELAGKETTLKTKIDCSIYAEQYLDTLEEISYLFNNKSLATDSQTYFENQFNYGMTLKKWYDKVVLGSESQTERWQEFEIYCENFKDEFGVPKKITGFGVVDTLPMAMIFYDSLAYDNIEFKRLSSQQDEKFSKKVFPPPNLPKWQEERREFYEDEDD